MNREVSSSDDVGAAISRPPAAKPTEGVYYDEWYMPMVLHSHCKGSPTWRPLANGIGRYVEVYNLFQGDNYRLVCGLRRSIDIGAIFDIIGFFLTFCIYQDLVKRRCFIYNYTTVS